MTKKPITGAVLLAAGRGKRLRPYTNKTPKPLLPVNGVPTLDLYFNSLARTSIKNTVLIVHHLADQLEDYASQVESRFGISCTTVRQAELDGTASALEAVFAQSKDNEMLHSIINEPFLMTATDYLLPASYLPDFLSFYLNNNEDIAVSIKQVPEEELSSRSSIRFAAAKSIDQAPIREIVEKPAPGEAPSNYSANLTYILPSAVLPLLAAVEHSARGEREVQSAINAYLATTGTARGLIQDSPAEWSPELLKD